MNQCTGRPQNKLLIDSQAVCIKVCCSEEKTNVLQGVLIGIIVLEAWSLNLLQKLAQLWNIFFSLKYWVESHLLSHAKQFLVHLFLPSSFISHRVVGFSQFIPPFLKSSQKDALSLVLQFIKVTNTLLKYLPFRDWSPLNLETRLVDVFHSSKWWNIEEHTIAGPCEHRVLAQPFCLTHSFHWFQEHCAGVFTNVTYHQVSDFADQCL